MSNRASDQHKKLTVASAVVSLTNPLHPFREPVLAKNETVEHQPFSLLPHPCISPPPIPQATLHCNPIQAGRIRAAFIQITPPLLPGKGDAARPKHHFAADAVSLPARSPPLRTPLDLANRARVSNDPSGFTVAPPRSTLRAPALAPAPMDTGSKLIFPSK